MRANPGRGDDPHMAPVVRQFLAAIQTDDISRGERGSGAPAGRKGKCGPPVMADEHRIENRLKH